MNDLMTHVERIVRPIGAIQGRKLRMRTELLTHLQATLEEELIRTPDDEPAAIERAKRRLGEPAELTRSLQRTVPTVEHLLLSRLPLPPSADRVERQMSCVVGQRGVMTIAHGSILVMAGTLLFVPYFITMLGVTTAGQPAVHLWPALAGSIVGGTMLWIASYHLVFAAAVPAGEMNWRATLRDAAFVLASEIALTFVVTLGNVDRAPTASELTTCVVATSALVLMAIAIARYVARLRRPYDAWLSLKLDSAPAAA